MNLKAEILTLNYLHKIQMRVILITTINYFLKIDPNARSLFKSETHLLDLSKIGLQSMPRPPSKICLLIVRIFKNHLHSNFIKMEKQAKTKTMIIGKFISLLLIFRPYLHEISGLPYTGIILTLLVIKKIKEGFTIGTLLQIISTLLILGGDLF